MIEDIPEHHMKRKFICFMLVLIIAINNIAGCASKEEVLSCRERAHKNMTIFISILKNEATAEEKKDLLADFSKHAADSVDLNTELANAANFIDGEIIFWEAPTGGDSWNTQSGHISEFTCSVDYVDTSTNNHYRIFERGYELNRDDPDLEGITEFIIVHLDENGETPEYGGSNVFYLCEKDR